MVQTPEYQRMTPNEFDQIVDRVLCDFHAFTMAPVDDIDPATLDDEISDFLEWDLPRRPFMSGLHAADCAQVHWLVAAILDVVQDEAEQKAWAELIG